MTGRRNGAALPVLLALAAGLAMCSSAPGADQVTQLKTWHRPGEKLMSTNKPLGGGAIQSGETAADKWGLVTLEKVKVATGGNRISIQRR